MPDVPLLGQRLPQVSPGNPQLAEVQNTNVELIKQLGMLGIGLDPMVAISARFVAMLNTMFPPDTPEGQAKQEQCELAFELKMAEILGEIKRQAVTAQLQAGAQMPREMLEEMARAQGIPAGLDGRHRKLYAVAQGRAQDQEVHLDLRAGACAGR